MSCGVGHRHSSDLTWLWLWHKLAAPIWPLIWELPYAAQLALKRQKIIIINKFKKSLKRHLGTKAINDLFRKCTEARKTHGKMSHSTLTLKPLTGSLLSVGGIFLHSYSSIFTYRFLLDLNDYLTFAKTKIS